MAKKKTKKPQIKKIDIDQILLRGRHLFAFDEISKCLSKELVKNMIALDSLNQKPIVIWINSPGGSVSDGFSVIDTMKSLASPTVTIIDGMACSMAGIISVAGDSRLMTENSIWMSHDMAGGIWGDYTTKVLDRANFLKKEQVRLFEFLKKYTKLSKDELRRAKSGELWLYADDCKKKGIVDQVIKGVKRNAKSKKNK